MSVYEIGSYIHDMRVERGYSQEELCFGICSPGNLSKIENGLRMPNRKTVEAFTQRLGCQEAFLQYSSREEMQQAELCSQIVQKIANYEYDGLEELIDRFEGTVAEEDILGSQCCRFTRIMLKQREEENWARGLQELEETLRMTKPDGIEMKEILKGLLTYREIAILINIARHYRKLGKQEEAKDLLLGLKQYMDTHIMDPAEKAQKYLQILYQLSKLFLDRKQYAETVTLCSQGIALSRETGRFCLFPRFQVNKGLALLKLREEDRAKEAFRKGYCAFYALGDEIHSQRLKTFLKEQWKAEFADHIL